MQEFTLLINIAVALVVAFIGGVAARRIGLPTIVGYLLAGIAIGPFTPGFVGDSETISQLAELGVIFLMFGVGLSISFEDLRKVGDIAIIGSLVQMALATLLGFGLSQLWGWAPTAGIVLGFAISNASSVVMMRGLMDNSLLNTPHGQAAIGWSIAQDLVTVIILVLMPSLAGAGLDWQVMGLAVLKTALFVALVLFVGARLIPWLLRLIVHTRSRELFILSVLVIALGTALSSAELFGVSLALGAFVAGVIIIESPLSHQVAADILPFREAFAVLFFVSVGMLVNPAYLFSHIGPVLALTALIMVGKPILITLLGFAFPRPARTALVVAMSNSQIGEFSFILGQTGLALGLLSRDQYSLILAGALLSITLNAGMFRSILIVEKGLRRFPALWRRLDWHKPAGGTAIELQIPSAGHVVIVGYGRVGRQVASLLEGLEIPLLVVHMDAEQVDDLRKRGIPGMFGDAANSEVLKNTGLNKARALVVAGPDETASELTVAAARDLAPELPIIARAVTQDGVKRLAELGAKYVIHAELEAGLEVLRHTLLPLGFPMQEITRYTDAVRQDRYDLAVNTQEEHQLLRNLIDAIQGIEVTWLRLEAGSPLVGQTLAEANLRARTGASVVAIMRGRQLMANPKSVTAFEAGDRIALIGDVEQIEQAERVVREGW